jgi:Putative DNA-binding domain
MASEPNFTDADRVRDEQLATVLWHPDLHRQAAQEDLAFLTIGFQPRYHRATALQIIDRAVAAVGVRSFTLWELQRKPDLLMKVWIPAGRNSDDLWRALSHEAETNPQIRLDLVDSTYIVQTTLHHYLWPSRLTATDIDQVLELGGDLLTSGTLFGELPKQLDALARRQLIAPLAAGATGIKFFIWLSLSELLPNERAKASLETELVRVVTTTPHVYATSIYRTLGVTPYLISGRFKPENYEVLAQDLQPRLSVLGEPFFATNTDTALSTMFSAVERTEALLPPPAKSSAPVQWSKPVLNIDELLRQDESPTLEIKGSAFTPIPLGESDSRHQTAGERASRSKGVRDAITKTCAGFLNSSGGVLLIGIIESERAAFDDAQRYNPDAVKVGNYIAVGIDSSIDGRRITWDEFERRLRSQLSTSITPPPDPWIEIHSLRLGTLKIAAIVVTQPNTWFWANTSTDQDVFYVRYGNATRPLRGPAQIQHMRSAVRD